MCDELPNRISTGVSAHDPWTVETTTGAVRGHQITGAVAFRGVPYARPPVGELRFRRARPRDPWRGVLLADRPGDYCAQWRNRTVGWTGSENCLWLNVVVPRPDGRSPVIDTGANRPVVVYLHGGSNIHGSAAEPLLSGEHFAAATDAVYVAVNYRVGIFGQLALGFADDLDPGRFDSNTGLSDIITAVEWVHDNAEAFGGDPHRITVMGESSGGAMVTALSAVPRMKNLVHGFIAQSPAAAMVHTPDGARRAADMALEILRSDDDGKKPRPEGTGKDLLTASPEGLAWLTERTNDAAWGRCGIAGGFAPVIDDLLPAHPLTPGAQIDIPLLIGTNLDEYVLMRWAYPSARAFATEARDFAETIDPDRAPVCSRNSTVTDVGAPTPDVSSATPCSPHRPSGWPPSTPPGGRGCTGWTCPPPPTISPESGRHTLWTCRYCSAATTQAGDPARWRSAEGSAWPPRPR